MSLDYWNTIHVDFSELKGQVIQSIRGGIGDDQLVFKTETDTYIMLHVQDCCESVYIEDIIGDLDDLVGCEILSATEDSNCDEKPLCENEESYTWTFYNIRSNRGSVTIRWYGSSNGYYSESASFRKAKKEKE